MLMSRLLASFAASDFKEAGMVKGQPTIGTIIKAMEEGYYIPPRYVAEVEAQLQGLVKSREILMTDPTDSCKKDLCTVREYKARNIETIMRGIQDHIKLIEVYESMGMHYDAEKCRAKLEILQKKARNFKTLAPFAAR